MGATKAEMGAMKAEPNVETKSHVVKCSTAGNRREATSPALRGVTLNMGLLAVFSLGGLFIAAAGALAAAPPTSVVAVANRDVEGAIVLDADEERNYQPNASACRAQCTNTTDCNVWVWCGAVSGCAPAGSYNRDASRFQQCWLKYDIPPRANRLRAKFPRVKNLFDQPTGWMSGVVMKNFTDAAPFPERGYSCPCRSNYTYNGYRFEGTCARLQEYGSQCLVDSTCRDAPTDNLQYCPSYQPCMVLLDTDLDEKDIIASGESNTADSAEDCSYQCASAKNCNLWTWCSDATGCNGERYRFRQCWLKRADPRNPQPKRGYGGSPGWISGVRCAWIPY